jgi:hypothetical protein
MQAYIIVGIGTPGPWSANASALRTEDVDLWKRARLCGLLDTLQARGGCTSTRDDGQADLTGGWISVCTADRDILEEDESVLAFCTVKR